jgi:tetratricopeptide (TPR) repeat protein
MFRQVQGSNRMTQAAEGFIGLAIGQAIAGRKDVARAGYERVERLKGIPDNAAYEVVALAALLNEPKVAQAYGERALQYLRKTSTPESMVGNETAGKALLALAAGHNQEAYDLAIAAGVNPREHNAPFVAGIAALRLKRWDDAAKAFTTMLGDRKRLGLSPLVAYAHIMLGRAHAGAHRVAEAKQAYDEAFKIWKDADSDLPLLLEARREYAELQ